MIAWLALPLIVFALAAAAMALTARSLIAASVGLIAIGACSSAALAACGAGDVGMGLALVCVGFAPFALLGVLLLSGRTVKPRRSGPAWLSLGAAVLALAAILAALPDLGAPARADAAPIAPWLTGLVFVAGSAGVALLSFGERGLAAREPR